MAPIRILIVDDHPVVRRGLRGLLEEELAQPTFGEADNAADGLALLQSQPWDIVLLDINMPGRDGFELLESINRLTPRPKVLIVSGYSEEEYAIQALKLGASGFINKAQAALDLVAAVRKVQAGGKYISASLAERLAGLLEEGSQDDPNKILSPRELQVLRLVASGLTVKEIASELCLSEKTIATYRARIGEKTGLSSSVELTRYAFRHRIIQ